VIFMAEPGVLRLRALRAVTRHPQVADAVLGAVLATVSLLMVVNGPDHGRGPGELDDLGRSLTALDVVAAVLAFALITLRRRWPLPVLAAATAAGAWGIAVGGLKPVLTVTAVICAYTVAVTTTRTIGWAAGAATAGALYLSGVLWAGDGWSAPQNLGTLAWTGMAVAVGDALRTRRAYVAAVEERAIRAEQSRDAEARRRVVEERLRIARELHDVVAHHIAMINVQAGVAAHVLRGQPDKAEEALGHVRQAARTVLDELSTVLSVLRQPDEPDFGTDPTRGLGRLAELLDSMAAAGLQVEHRQDGDARPLPSPVDMAAYRIVQESLTNAQKHGTGAARLRVTYTVKGVSIVVRNAVTTPAAAAPGGGHGLIGMRERAAAVGGTLRTGPDRAGHFSVYADLPAPDRGTR
jgi:signal transduction histidine kinase